jgi:hypothetical protein
MLKHLQPLFDADYLLPRSFIASVDLEDLQELIETKAIPVDACLAHLTYRLKTHKPHKYYHRADNCYRLYEMKNDEKVVAYFLHYVIKGSQLRSKSLNASNLKF